MGVTESVAVSLPEMSEKQFNLYILYVGTFCTTIVLFECLYFICTYSSAVGG